MELMTPTMGKFVRHAKVRMWLWQTAAIVSKDCINKILNQYLS